MKSSFSKPDQGAVQSVGADSSGLGSLRAGPHRGRPSGSAAGSPGTDGHGPAHGEAGVTPINSINDKPLTLDTSPEGLCRLDALKEQFVNFFFPLQSCWWGAIFFWAGKNINCNVKSLHQKNHAQTQQHG